MSQADPSEVSRMTGRLAEQGMISGLLNVMRSNTIHRELAFEISWIFLNLAVPTEGCAILLEHDVPCQMLGMFDLATVSFLSNKTMENILWLIGNIAGENGDVVARLLSSGVYDQCLEVLAQIAEHPEQAAIETTGVVAWLFGNIFRHKTSRCFSTFRRALPHIVALLNKLDERARGVEEVFLDLAWCCSYMFAEQVADVDWTLLHSTGLLARLYAISRTNAARLPVSRIVGNAAAHDDSAVTKLILDDAAFAWLSVIASLPAPRDTVQKDHFWLLSNIAADEHNFRESFVHWDLFGPTLRRAAARLWRRDVTNATAWAVCNEASWALNNILTEPHSEAVPPALLRAGAVDFIAAALAHPNVYRIPEAGDFVKRLTECVSILLNAGSTERDEAYIEHGGPPSNEYLAAFCAAGAGPVLMGALHSTERPARLVVGLFDSLIGPMVGADGPPDVDRGVPSAFLRLLDLNTVNDGAPVESGDDSGGEESYEDDAQDDGAQEEDAEEEDDDGDDDGSRHSTDSSEASAVDANDDDEQCDPADVAAD
jgi:hypothetical protein